METRTFDLMRELEEEHWWFVARRKILTKLIEQLRQPSQAQILEVGCGTGGNIEMLQNFGEVTCIESDSKAAGIARDRNKTPILNGHLPDGLPVLNKKFDLIALFDVIEHIKHDKESIQTLVKLLDPGGRIIVTVPAFNFLWSIHDDENHHQRRYRKRDIVSLAEQVHLKIDYVSYFNFWLFPSVATIRLVRKIFPYKESWKDMSKPPGCINNLLQQVFSSERFLLGNFSLPFGISLVAVMSPKTDEYRR